MQGQWAVAPDEQPCQRLRPSAVRMPAPLTASEAARPLAPAKMPMRTLVKRLKSLARSGSVAEAIMRMRTLFGALPVE